MWLQYTVKSLQCSEVSSNTAKEEIQMQQQHLSYDTLIPR